MHNESVTDTVSVQESSEISESRETAYRFVTYAAVVFSLVAIATIFITLPLANQYINEVQNRVQLEMDFCRLSAAEVMSELWEINSAPISEPPKQERDPIISGNEASSLPLMFRIAMNRQQNGTSGSRVRREANSRQCEGCCLPGLPGPPGTPGRNGVPGRPGAAGAPGFPGPLPEELCREVTQPPCIPCPPGEVGPTGPIGEPGNSGPVGFSGRNGNEGPPGPTGPQGPPGSPGDQGREGPRGEAGRPAISTSAIPGEPGPQGEQGLPGLPGNSGETGRPGSEGLPGPQGPPGMPGPPGPTGRSGESGQKGHPGPQGERGVCPKYCALDGGVFFEDGTRR